MTGAACGVEAVNGKDAAFVRLTSTGRVGKASEGPRGWRMNDAHSAARGIATAIRRIEAVMKLMNIFFRLRGIIQPWLLRYANRFSQQTYFFIASLDHLAQFLKEFSGQVRRIGRIGDVIADPIHHF